MHGRRSAPPPAVGRCGGRREVAPPSAERATEMRSVPASSIRAEDGECHEERSVRSDDRHRPVRSGRGRRPGRNARRSRPRRAAVRRVANTDLTGVDVQVGEVAAAAEAARRPRVAGEPFLVIPFRGVVDDAAERCPRDAVGRARDGSDALCSAAPSAAIIHVLRRSSYATTGSLTRPGYSRNPRRHVRPASRDAAQPISAAPPSMRRPDWKAVTIVEPAEAVRLHLGSRAVPGSRLTGPRHLPDDDFAVGPDRVGGLGVHQVVAAATEHCVALGVVVDCDPVVAQACEDEIAADAAVEEVAARPAVEVVVAATAWSRSALGVPISRSLPSEPPISAACAGASERARAPAARTWARPGSEPASSGKRRASTDTDERQ